MWYETERARLVGVCAALSGDRDAAEDLAQETLLEAWRHRHKLADPRGADRWLTAIARNVCLRWGRTRAVLPIPTDEVPDAPAAHEDGIAELIDLLPPGSRQVIVQRFVHERTHEEIAATLGISSDAVAMRLARGKQVLRRILAESEWRTSGVYCPQCGTRRLLLRQTAGEIEFACRACAVGDVLVRYPLDNPQFAKLVGGLERPTAMLRRVGDWVVQYFAGGAAGSALCTRCAQRVVVRTHVRAGRIPGLYVRCDACGEEVWSALAGLANALPAVRDLRRRRLVGIREERGVLAVVHSSVDGSKRVEVGFDRLTYALRGIA